MSTISHLKVCVFRSLFDCDLKLLELGLLRLYSGPGLINMVRFGIFPRERSNADLSRERPLKGFSVMSKPKPKSLNSLLNN